MPSEQAERVDEVSRHYRAPAKAAAASWWLFCVGVALSFAMPFSKLIPNGSVQQLVAVAFVVVALTQFVVDQAQRFYWLPRAEKHRRRALVSDAFGAAISHDRTSLYHNNDTSPSVRRLAANVLENALFSEAIAGAMLQRTRLVTGLYTILWLIAFAIRHNNLDVLTGITQVVFSAHIVSGWLSLEVLRARFERTYDDLRAYFRSSNSASSPNEVAEVVDAVVAYESAKANAGILLDSKIFERLNPELSERWLRVRAELSIDDSKSD